MASEVVFILSNYFIHIFIARYLGVEAYGVFGVLMSLYLINRAFLNTGVPKAVSKFIAESSNTSGVVKASLRLQLILALLFASGYILLAPVLAKLLGDATLLPYIIILGVIVVPLALQSLYLGGFLNGLRLFREQAFMKALFPLCRVLFTVVLIVLGLGLYGALFALFLASFVGIIGVRRLLERKIHGEGEFSYHQLVKFALPLSIAALGFALIRNVNVLFLKGLLQDNVAAGLYTAALTLSNLPYMVFTALPLALFPSISRAIANQNEKLAHKYIQQSVRYALLLLLPVSAMMAASSADLVRLFYSADYSGAASALSILLWSGAALSLFTVMTSVVSASGRPGVEMWMAYLFLGLMSVLNIILIPRYGIVGAAWSSLLTALIGFVLAMSIVVRRFGPVVKLRSVLNIGFASAWAFLLMYLQHFSGVLLLLSYALLFLVYISVLFIVGELRAEDWQVVQKIFKRPRLENAGNR